MAANPSITRWEEPEKPLELPQELEDNLVKRGFPRDELERLVERPRRRNRFLRALRRDLLGV